MTTCVLVGSINNNNKNNNNRNKNYKYYKNNIYNIIHNIKSASSHDYTYDELKRIVDILLEQLKKQTKEVEKLEDFINNNNIYKNNNYDRLNDNSNMISYYERQVVILQDQIADLKDKLIEAETPDPVCENICCVCLNEATTHANRNCGHMCVCEGCSYQLDDKCPICRTQGQFMKIIKS